MEVEIFKGLISQIDKVDNAEDGVYIEGYLSTPIQDRQGDVIPTEEWEPALKKFVDDPETANPVVVLNHDMKRPVGKLVSYEIREKGPWVKAHIVDPPVVNLIKKGVLRAFSWAGRAKKVVENGQVFRRALDMWEVTIATAGVNPQAVFNLAKGISFDELSPEVGTFLLNQLYNYYVENESQKAVMDAHERNELDSSSFAYVDSKGEKHLPIHDASHVRDAISRFDQTQFEDSEDKVDAAKKILSAAKKFGIDVSADSSVAKTATQKAINEGNEMTEDQIKELVSKTVGDVVKATVPEVVKATVQETLPEVIKAVVPAGQKVSGGGKQDEKNEDPLAFLSKGIDKMDRDEKDAVAQLTIAWLQGRI